MQDFDSKAIQTQYLRYTQRKKWFMAIIAVLLGLISIIGISLGSANITILDIVKVFIGQGQATHVQIICKIRIPRVFSAALAGAALAISGVVMQSILRNPMGSPFTLGISQAAAFGVAFTVVVLGAGSIHSSSSDAVIINNPYIVTLSAFICSLACMSIVLLLIQLKKDTTPEAMILIGIILGSLFSAATTALEYFADDVELASIIFWTFGDLGRANWIHFMILFVIIVPSTLYFIKNGWNYTTLGYGDETAKSLGVDAEGTRIKGMIVTSLLTAMAVSFFGIIAFIGLVVPHIVRRFIGSDERFVIPASALFGAFFLLFSDTVARTIISPVVLPVGILTSFLGAPLFLYLLLKRRNFF